MEYIVDLFRMYYALVFFNSFIGILLSYNSNKTKINKFNTVEMAERE